MISCPEGPVSDLQNNGTLGSADAMSPTGVSIMLCIICNFH